MRWGSSILRGREWLRLRLVGALHSAKLVGPGFSMFRFFSVSVAIAVTPRDFVS